MFVIISGASMAGGQEKDSQAAERSMSTPTLKDVLRQHTTELMSLPGVVGTAQGLCEGSACIKVLVTDKTPQLEQEIDDILKGYPYEIQKTGKIKALPVIP
jgi:hypothetical protein